MRARKRSGHVMVELALASGVMLTALGGTFQFGYSFYVYNHLVTAVGNGARYASGRPYRAATAADIEKGNAAIRNMVVFGSPHASPGSAPLAAGLQPHHVRVEWVDVREGVPSAVSVSVVGYKVNGIFGTMDLDGRPAAQFPYLGGLAPAQREP